MPKNKVQTVPINKKVFQYILKEKNSSIRKLGAAQEIAFTEKTIRRALNNSEMRPELVKQIAIYLNIDSTLLTGEMVKKAFSAKNKIFRKEELLNFDINLQMEENYDPDYKSPFEEKYANYSVITEYDTDEDILRKEKESLQNSAEDKT